MLRSPTGSFTSPIELRCVLWGATFEVRSCFHVCNDNIALLPYLHISSWSPGTELGWRDTTCRNREFLKLTVLKFDRRQSTCRRHDFLNPTEALIKVIGSEGARASNLTCCTANSWSLQFSNLIDVNQRDRVANSWILQPSFFALYKTSFKKAAIFYDFVRKKTSSGMGISNRQNKWPSQHLFMFPNSWHAACMPPPSHFFITWGR